MVKKVLLEIFPLTILVSLILIVTTATSLVFEWLGYIYLDVMGLPPVVIGDAESPQECLNVGIAQKLWFGFLIFAVYFFYLLIKKLNQLETKIDRL